MSTTSRYIVGIDLGTTHSVLAYLDTATLGEDGPPPRPQLLAIPQIVLPGVVEARPMLPSFLYLAAKGEFPAGALDLPWPGGQDRDYVVGELARQHGALVPMRLVSSAKSWLAYDGVDRTAAVLPFAAPAEGPDAVPKVSPVEAAARYLGAEPGRMWIEQVKALFSHMARIAVRPEWVGIMDFERRFPSAIESAMSAHQGRGAQ